VGLDPHEDFTEMDEDGSSSSTRYHIT
jgi:hypothetical protein